MRKVIKMKEETKPTIERNTERTIEKELPTIKWIKQTLNGFDGDFQSLEVSGVTSELALKTLKKVIKILPKHERKPKTDIIGIR